MCELLSLNQKISSLSENLEKAVNDMKVQDRSVDLLHENIKILQNKLAQKNKIINRQCLIRFQQEEITKLSQINNNNNNKNLNNC